MSREENSGHDDPLLSHEYDGIQEYDNPLPGWWKWLFVATIVWSVPYFAYYHFGNQERTRSAHFDSAMGENMRLQFDKLGEIRPDTITLVRFANEESGVLIGKSIYKTHCVACHGPEGGGGVGPNLTDESYKNIRAIDDILRVVNVGAAGGAMPAWQAKLEERERIMVSSYVAWLRGKNVPGGKAADGQAIAPWPTVDEVNASAAAAAEAAAVTPPAVPSAPSPVQP